MSRQNYKATVICSTDGMTEADWLQFRKTGIGGSDAGTIMGVNPYKTRRELFFDKTGVKPVNTSLKSTLPLRFGHALENTVAEEFSIKTGLRVYEIKEMYQHPLHPIMQGNIDRFVDFPDGTVGILECKTANPESKFKWADGAIPFCYECQVRHYMCVMNIDTAYIACLFDNNTDNMVIRKIERDYDFEDNLIRAEEEFWNNFVLKNKVPPLIEDPTLCFATIDKYVQSQINKKPVDLSAFGTVLPQIADLKSKKKALEDQSKALQKQIDSLIVPILDSMGNQTYGEAIVDDKKYEITYKPSTKTTINKDNLERLRIAHENIYDEYATESVSRRLTFKVK